MISFQDRISPDIFSYVSSVLLETAFFSIFTVLIVISTWILMRKGLNSRPSKAMLAATFVMYAAATAHWAVQLDVFFQSDEDETDQLYQCAPAALLSVNIILSDIIVLWRAWILRSGGVFRTVSIFLLLGTIILSIAGTVQNCDLTISSGFEVISVSAFTDTVRLGHHYSGHSREHNCEWRLNSAHRYISDYSHKSCLP
ncbi:hypothetical protein OF83DRAFT_1115379 [Amylostereum chailletii]|nr:hypothetical protein OF83DRAFT_1115379 [Amylostereum chailletii]